MAVGRFAPSPTGDLHLGNLRTALVAWLFARSAGSSFLVRMEDLDRVQASADHERSQLADLAALGLDWDGEVVRQSERFDRYEAAIAQLDAAGPAIAAIFDQLEMPLSRVLEAIEERGVAVDIGVLAAQGKAIGAEIDKLRAEIEAEAGHPLNPDSPLQAEALAALGEPPFPVVETVEGPTDRKSVV